MARIAAMAAVALVLVACSEGAAAPSTTALSEAPTAPDFTLELGAGGTFTLSQETRPVFLVFWAEW
jgi:hypothetical protein